MNENGSLKSPAVVEPPINAENETINVASAIKARPVQVQMLPVRMSPSLLGFAACLVFLASAVKLVPEAIRTSAEDRRTQSASHAHLQKVIHDSIAADHQHESAELPVYLMPKHHTQCGLIDATNPHQSVRESEELRFARFLVSKGRKEAAVPYYETALKADKRSIPVRLELIDAYLAAGKHSESRAMCLNTMKLRPTNDQLASLWKFYSRCQTD